MDPHAERRLRDRTSHSPTLTVILAAGLVLAACGGDAEGDGENPGSEQSRGAGNLVEISPLTGVPVGNNAPEHLVLVVKIDNTAPSAPQVGLGDADLVVEELVEGGSTRLAVMFWEKTPEVVGPVRSTRATDIGIVRPVDAVLVASGGAPRTIRQIAEAEIPVLQEGDPGFSRDDSRSAPYNLMMDLEELAGSLDAATPPAAYLPFGPEESWPGGKPAKDRGGELLGRPHHDVAVREGHRLGPAGHLRAAGRRLRARQRAGGARRRRRCRISRPRGQPGAGDGVLRRGRRHLVP
jgi:hypothetical protein